jgi:uncharacterized lipoprotein
VEKMRYLKFNIVFIIFLLVGCSAIEKLDKSDEYKSTPAHDKRLVLLKGMSANVIENHYPLPKASSKGSAAVSIEPPGDDGDW